jgi:hypothetical protein
VRIDQLLNVLLGQVLEIERFKSFKEFSYPFYKALEFTFPHRLDIVGERYSAVV